MATASAKELKQKRCVPCEGGVPKLSEQEVSNLLNTVSGWKLTHGGQRIRKDWVVKNFVAGMQFFEGIAQLAESEGHHPDLHLEGYRNVWIEIWTHAIGGLSENDFILAAKIDDVPVEQKK